MRRTTLIIACFCCSLLAFSGLVRAQATFSVAYDTVNFIQPPSTSFGNVVTYSIDVVNNTPTSFFGTVSFMRRVGNGPADTIFTETVPDTVPAFGSRSFQVGDTVSSFRFGGGINVVVVWPTAPNVVTLDSATGEIFVEGVGIPEEFNDAYPITVFPNPTSESVRFQTQFSPLKVRSTTLYDQQGRSLRAETGLPTQVDLGGLPAGIYFLEVAFRDGALRRFKVVKAD